MATVELIISEPVREMVMNGDGLYVSAEPLQPDTLEQEPVESYRPDEEQVVLTFDRAIPPGKFRLTLRFDGRLAEDLRGFYRTVATDPDGRESVIASTQCEPTDARRVFPCWDEPAFKASFALTLVIDPALEAYSNGREIRNVIDPVSGKRRVTFAETVPLSTYVVALAVGHFHAGEPEASSGTPVRIIARPHMARLTTFARDEAIRHLQFFEDYFGIRYPGEKLDHIAIPDFAAGAMENLGLITYREEALLVDAKAASPRELIGISEVIAHETAHMWFGDRVTMRWWNGIWLNEVFATFMSVLAVNALHPDWDIWSMFARGRADALSVDSLASTRPIEYPVGRPEEVEGMFDVLTYEKGGAILRMLE